MHFKIQSYLQPIEMKLCLSHKSCKSMPGAKFECGSFSIFEDMASHNFSLKREQVIKFNNQIQHSNSAFYSVKLCVMINFSLHHNVLFLKFCTPHIAYMQLLKWFSLMKEVVM